MKAILTIGVVSASLAFLPITAEAGFCGSGKNSKRHYYPQITPALWQYRTPPGHYYYYSYPLILTRYQ